MQLAIDDHIVTGDLDGLQSIILLLVGVLMFEGVFGFTNAYLTQWIGQQAIYDVRIRVYRHIQQQALRFFDRTPIGKLITRTTSDVEALSDVLSAGVIVIIGDLFRLIFITAFMFSLNPVLALVTLAVMPLMLWVTFWFKRKVRTQYRETRRQVARLNAFIQEHVTGMNIVQLFNREREEMRRFDTINDEHRIAWVKTIFYFALFWPAVDIIASMAIGLVLWAGGVNAMSGTLTLGVLIAFVQYARQFFEPIRNLSDQFNTLQGAMAGAERIFNLLDEDHALDEPDEPVAVERIAGRIEFQNVWFSYDDLHKSNQHAMSGTLTLGVLIAFVQYARQFFEPIRNLSDQFNTLQGAMAGAERIFNLLDEDHALDEPDEPVAVERIAGRIEFQKSNQHAVPRDAQAGSPAQRVYTRARHRDEHRPTLQPGT